MSSEPVVHVVDDEEPIRESLSMLLDSAGLTAVTHPDARSFLAAMDPDAPDCVVADVRMPGMSGLELQRHLKALKVDLPVIIITGHGDVSMAVQALKEGAADFIEKPFDDEVLLTAVRSALDKGRRAWRERQVLADIQSRVAELTPREREVMSLVVRGLPNKAVATELNISVRTVEIHRARVMEKMEAKGLSELVRMALRLEEDEDGGGVP